MTGPGDCHLSALVIDTVESANWLIPGKKVKVSFKEIEVMISPDPLLKISAQNRLPCQIKSMKVGVLLAQVELLFHEIMITSIITANACRLLNLQENDAVLAVIKTNEISIAPDD
jgi:molybdopterin-binding protein